LRIYWIKIHSMARLKLVYHRSSWLLFWLPFYRACIKKHISEISLSRICRWLSLNLSEETCWVVKNCRWDWLVVWVLISLLVFLLRLGNKLKSSVSVFINMMSLVRKFISSWLELHLLFHLIFKFVNLHIHSFDFHLIVIFKTIDFLF